MTAPVETQSELMRRIIVVLVVLLLAAASLWMLLPFLPAIVWAGTIVVATWPVLLAVQARLGGRRAAATAVMTGAMFLVFFVPLMVAVSSLVNHAGDVAGWGREVAANGLPEPPAWVAGIPLLGRKVDADWRALAALDGPGFIARVSPWIGRASTWLLDKAGGMLVLTVQFLLTLVVTALLYASGERVAAGVLAFARRLNGERGEELMRLAARSVRGVALGVVVTALVQALLTGISLALTGIPGAALLTGASFLLCLAQVGPGLVLVPSVAWLYWSGHPGAGTVLLVATLVVGTLDNVLRPMLIKRGANLPLLLVFTGVLGGMLAFGIIGIFVGPVVLAVGWTLLGAWVRGDAGVGASAA